MTPLVAVAGRQGQPSRVSRDAVCFAGRRYLDCVLRAGGEPVVLATQEISDDGAAALVDRFDALLLMGGGDVDPAWYGEETGPLVYGVLPVQDRFEMALLRAALARRIPVLAVCRGMQVANVVLGGSLVQDIGELPPGPVHVDHKPTGFPVGAEFALHELRLEQGSILAGATGSTSLHGASFHHQGIARTGAGLRPVAWAPDGLLEAFEHEDQWLVGVQWHPEDTAADDPLQQRLYDRFVAEAASG